MKNLWAYECTMRPCFNPGVFFIVLIALAPAHGRDVYGNATPWTNSDTIIWELHQKQNAFVPPVSSGPSWQAQLSARASQKQFQAGPAKGVMS